jgi:hypothetical protein
MTENADLLSAAVITGGIDTGTAQIVFGIENACRRHLCICKQPHGTADKQSVATHNSTLSY